MQLLYAEIPTGTQATEIKDAIRQFAAMVNAAKQALADPLLDASNKPIPPTLAAVVPAPSLLIQLAWQDPGLWQMFLLAAGGPVSELRTSFPNDPTQGGTLGIGVSDDTDVRILLCLANHLVHCTGLVMPIHVHGGPPMEPYRHFVLDRRGFLDIPAGTAAAWAENAHKKTFARLHVQGYSVLHLNPSTLNDVIHDDVTAQAEAIAEAAGTECPICGTLYVQDEHPIRAAEPGAMPGHLLLHVACRCARRTLRYSLVEVRNTVDREPADPKTAATPTTTDNSDGELRTTTTTTDDPE